jgi:hypothetical protein
MFTIAAASLALIASCGVALAVDDTGTITQVNPTVGTITLDNGKTYVLPPYLQADFNPTVGEKVKVTYEDMIISQITKAA